MHKLVINRLGPIEHCELECKPFMTFTGFQASGKSTVAKAVYFFRTVKDDILAVMKSQSRTDRFDYVREESFGENYNRSLVGEVEKKLHDKFLQTFGSPRGMSDAMSIEYRFTEDCTVKICLKNDSAHTTQNNIWVVLGESLSQYLISRNNIFLNMDTGLFDDEAIRAELNTLFDDEYSVVYIPAGRSMLTLLSQQLGYIYAVMDDVQKRSLDSCTRDYIERILRIKPQFAEGYMELADRLGSGKTGKNVNTALGLIQKVLRGSYRFADGEERIELKNGRYVKLNFASSGQQESVWILNLLYYYMLQEQKILFIIEEPESHLFPESQKYMTEFIAFISNCGHEAIVTTHSPYVLGTLNNLLFADTIEEEKAESAAEIIPQEFWIDYRKFGAWFVESGLVEECMDDDIHMVQNERIDEISKVINGDFERLLSLRTIEDGGE